MLSERLAKICDKIIFIGFVLLFSLVPLLLTPWNYELFEFNKMIAVYTLTVVIVGAWIVKSLNQRQFVIAKTPLDLPIALFVFSQLISTFFSIDKYMSWFGYYSRFNGGMFSIICYVLLYYAFVSNQIEVKKIFKSMLITATLVAIYAVLERLGIDKKLWVQDVQNRVFSTLGQPNWLAAYLVALIPLTLALALHNRLYTIISVLFFVVLLFTRSRSGLMGFAVADLLFWWLTIRQKKIVKPAVILHAIFALIIFLNGSTISQIDKYFSLNGWKNILTKSTKKEIKTSTVTSPALETGGTESGTIRKYVWQTAVKAWLANPKNFLIGTGTETYALTFYQYRPAGHNKTSEWDFLYNKAHNEYLNYLATTGIFGLGSYLLLIGTFIIWFIKMLNVQCQMLNKKQNNQDPSLIIALFSGWLSILFTNFFGFSVVVIQLLFFLIPAMLVETKEKKIQLKIEPKWPIIFTITSMFLMLYCISRYWFGDKYFALGYRYNKSGASSQAQPWLVKAIKTNPLVPLYHDEYASALTSLTVSAIEEQDATSAATLAKQALRQSDLAIKQEPNNVNFWKTRTKIFYTFSTFDPEFLEAAIAALEKTRSFSPTDPKIVYNLAVLVGRQNNNTEAIRLLQEAIRLKINYRDAYWALYLFYNETRQPDLARQTLQTYLETVDAGDQDFKTRLGL